MILFLVLIFPFLLSYDINPFPFPFCSLIPRLIYIEQELGQPILYILHQKKSAWYTVLGFVVYLFSLCYFLCYYSFFISLVLYKVIVAMVAIGMIAIILKPLYCLAWFWLKLCMSRYIFSYSVLALSFLLIEVSKSLVFNYFRFCGFMILFFFFSFVIFSFSFRCGTLAQSLLRA